MPDSSLGRRLTGVAHTGRGRKGALVGAVCCPGSLLGHPVPGTRESDRGQVNSAAKSEETAQEGCLLDRGGLRGRGQVSMQCRHISTTRSRKGAGWWCLCLGGSPKTHMGSMKRYACPNRGCCGAAVRPTPTGSFLFQQTLRTWLAGLVLGSGLWWKTRQTPSQMT